MWARTICQRLYCKRFAMESKRTKDHRHGSCPHSRYPNRTLSISTCSLSCGPSSYFTCAFRCMRSASKCPTGSSMCWMCCAVPIALQPVSKHGDHHSNGTIDRCYSMDCFNFSFVVVDHVCRYAADHPMCASLLRNAIHSGVFAPK